MDDYLQAAMRRAVYEVDSDGSAWGSVVLAPDLIVSATARTQRQCHRDLQHGLRRAIEQALEGQRALPPLDGVTPPAPQVAARAG
jgi:hypothetical protein